MAIVGGSCSEENRILRISSYPAWKWCSSYHWIYFTMVLFMAILTLGCIPMGYSHLSLACTTNPKLHYIAGILSRSRGTPQKNLGWSKQTYYLLHLNPTYYCKWDKAHRKIIFGHPSLSLYSIWLSRSWRLCQPIIRTLRGYPLNKSNDDRGFIHSIRRKP